GGRVATLPGLYRGRHGFSAAQPLRGSIGSAYSPGPGKEHAVPVFKLVDEHGTWLSDLRLGGPDWKPGGRIIPGRRDTLEVVEVRDGDDKAVLVVRPGQALNVE